MMEQQRRRVSRHSIRINEIRIRRRKSSYCVPLVIVICLCVCLPVSAFLVETQSWGQHQRFQVWMSASVTPEGESSSEHRHNKKKQTSKHNQTTRDDDNAHLVRRISQLEQLVASQAVEIRRLKGQCHDLTEAVSAFSEVIDLLREAGLSTPKSSNNEPKTKPMLNETKVLEDDIFGKIPESILDAADTAGAAILAGLLAGKQRMLVDVRDAELSGRNPEILVQFLELAILPVAAGLEGLKSRRNRLRIVFPTVSQLLEYRKTMALAAPEVVALSTLGFDPVEKRDNLVVILAPAPDDDEGWTVMNALLDNGNNSSQALIPQPVVVVNPHMVPITGPAAKFEVAYHLRLLSVQFMSGRQPQEYFKLDKDAEASINSTSTSKEKDDAALEAAMKHAQEKGMSQGMTRAMVIRAYPKPWHVFVDTSPDTDAEFEVAATFDEEPSQDDVNLAIVECLEGSEQEDQLVAQQMQQALESGQLDQVSEMLKEMDLLDEDEDDEDDEDLWDIYGGDSV